MLPLIRDTLLQPAISPRVANSVLPSPSASAIGRRAMLRPELWKYPLLPQIARYGDCDLRARKKAHLCSRHPAAFDVICPPKAKKAELNLNCTKPSFRGLRGVFEALEGRTGDAEIQPQSPRLEHLQTHHSCPPVTKGCPFGDGSESTVLLQAHHAAPTEGPLQPPSACPTPSSPRDQGRSPGPASPREPQTLLETALETAPSPLRGVGYQSRHGHWQQRYV